MTPKMRSYSEYMNCLTPTSPILLVCARYPQQNSNRSQLCSDFDLTRLASVWWCLKLQARTTVGSGLTISLWNISILNSSWERIVEGVHYSKLRKKDVVKKKGNLRNVKAFQKVLRKFFTQLSPCASSESSAQVRFRSCPLCRVW